VVLQGQPVRIELGVKVCLHALQVVHLQPQRLDHVIALAELGASVVYLIGVRVGVRARVRIKVKVRVRVT
jgi:hypothetical protein